MVPVAIRLFDKEGNDAGNTDAHLTRVPVVGDYISINSVEYRVNKVVFQLDGVQVPLVTAQA